ncbi:MULTISPECIES: fatty-acid--CoA ligase FadD1 [Mycolicibacter]|uniref:Acyl-CoA synthetase n=1 Tax=Mycolicibacter virginiensis TaxID=1795032 RepID=A0A9X7IL96_9MYCO|nr:MULTISPECIES: fatty-acid--CoA ligase FadD1 [Mycolicibacter]OBJ28539.1 acyl-CoA synthetase [Mycolicibacter heraklionensis]PQM51212.1 acyl-CoA synthetase [Mycolicibacter virginiensis]ULP47648.1 fatty-acid--CoA ligase FadD1 [Mycolicibacter virginiensis]
MAETMQQLLAERIGDTGLAVLYNDAEGEQIRWSWREYLVRAARHGAAVLARADADRPMHVGALLGNTPAMLTALAAAGLGGYVLCGVNDTRRGSALAGDLRTADVQLLLVDAEHRALLQGLELPGVTVIDVDDPAWASECADAGVLQPHRQVGPLDPFMLIFTSGTSGDPKAVLVSHFMVLVAGQSLTERFELGADDVVYLSMPLFHSNAIAAGFGPAVAAGAAMAPAKFSASRFLADIRAYGGTYMNYVGKPFAYLLAHPERPDDAENPLRVAFGNEASERDIGEFSRRFGVHVVDAFGSTENAVTITRDEGTPPGSVGRGFPGVAIYKSDPVSECPPAVFDEHGALINADEAIGELVNTAGSGFFSGYYNNEQATADRMRDGMYWSGDLAYADADGWIYLAGRTADWMRVDGENLAAAPIERILMRHPDINQAAVYAVPDGNVGDQVMAALVLRDGARLTEGEFADFLVSQEDLSPKAWPRYVRLTEELPSTATNKILKRVLVADGTDVGADNLWERPERERTYRTTTTTGARR